MNKIHINLKETMEMITLKLSHEEFVDIWTHITHNGFVFNEFTLVLKDFYTYKVKIIDYDFEQKIKVKKIWEMPDHTHKNKLYEFNVIDYLENIEKGITKLRGKNFLEMATDMKTVRETWAADVLPVMVFIQYVVYKAMNPEIKEMGVTQKRYKPVAERTYKPSSKKVYKLIDVVRKYEKHINHAKRHMTCDYWEVKGHFRHYKNGKVVYVKPYSKGKGKEERSTVDREYKL